MNDFITFTQLIAVSLILVSIAIDFFPSLKHLKNHKLYRKFEVLVFALIVINIISIVVSLIL